MGFGDDNTKVAAYMFAGLSMMLNIRLVYSASPYALLRFKLPENLFSVFVRIMAGSLELWCLPSMTIGNVMDYVRKGLEFNSSPRNTMEEFFRWQSIFWNWCNFVTFVILFIVYVTGGEHGHLTAFYWVIAASGFVFGIYMVMVYAMEFQYLAWYMIGENSFPMVTSFIHYVGTLIFGNRRKWNSDFIIVMIDIVISLAISLVAAVIWTWAYKTKSDEKFPSVPYHKKCISKLQLKPESTGTNYTIDTVQNYIESHATSCGYKTTSPINYYGHLVPPAIMVLVGMGLVYSIYPGIAPGMIVPFYLVDKIEMVLLVATAFPPIIIGILKKQGIDAYVFKGYWGGSHKEVTANGDLTLTSTSGSYTNSSTREITLTINTAKYKTGTDSPEKILDLGGGTNNLVITSNGDINTSNTYTLTRKTGTSLNLTLKAEDSSITNDLNGGTYNVSLNITSEITLTGCSSTCKLKKTTDSEGNPTTVSLGTYSITNGSGSTSITGQPQSNDLHTSHQSTNCCYFGNQNTWSTKHEMYTWHSFTILAPFQICLAGIFIHCLHYRDSSIARSIVNQPKMSTFLSIIFYMCHEIMLAMGFPGIATDDNILLPMQLIGAYIMVLLAYYSVGYITEYKRHDPSKWPTEGMTKWNAMCYWLKMASKITNKNFKQLFTTDLRRDLVLRHKETKFIIRVKIN